MSNKIVLLCSHCNEEIKETDESIVCENCGMSYHKLCWDIHSGCATFACSENKVAEQSVINEDFVDGDFENFFNTYLSENQAAETVETAVSANVCEQCGTEYEPGMKFCMKCGAKLPEANKEKMTNVCEQCGTEYEPGMKFCMKCGAELPETNKEKMTNVCEQCGTEYEPGMKFCMKCGNALREEG